MANQELLAIAPFWPHRPRLDDWRADRKSLANEPVMLGRRRKPATLTVIDGVHALAPVILRGWAAAAAQIPMWCEAPVRPQQVADAGPNTGMRYS